VADFFLVVLISDVVGVRVASLFFKSASSFSSSASSSVPSNSCSSSESAVRIDADVDVEDVDDDDDDDGLTAVKNAPVRSNSRIVPSVKPAITRRPDDVAVIDVHSSLMGNDDVNRRNDDDDDGILITVR
jgi:hypothetical protein